MREGPQPPACVIESCDERPVGQGEVYCKRHLATMAGGSALTPPIVEPDDPDLIERLAKQAAAQEEQEYAERRRVRSWRTLENGSRVPETFWSDEELEAIEARAGEQVRGVAARVSATPTALAATAAEEDPVKVATRRFKRALKGRYGPAVERLAWAVVESLQDE